uniref:COMM domain-containing protein 1 n=1 Tax=Astyanax mexicanus TaxID=7994 RepID=A0A8B9JKN0_ASTMX
HRYRSLTFTVNVNRQASLSSPNSLSLCLSLCLSLSLSLSLFQSMATADMDQAQLEAFLTAQTRKQGGAGLSSEQAAALGRFWKAHRTRIRESLLAQSRWEPGLRSVNWRVDLQTASSRGSSSNTPVALVELELGQNGQDSEFVCLEFDELKVNQVLKKMAEIQENIDSIVHHS